MSAAVSGECIEESIGGDMIGLTATAHQPHGGRVQQEEIQIGGQPVQQPGSGHFGRQYPLKARPVELRQNAVIENPGSVDDPSQSSRNSSEGSSDIGFTGHIAAGENHPNATGFQSGDNGLRLG